MLVDKIKLSQKQPKEELERNNVVIPTVEKDEFRIFLQDLRMEQEEGPR